MWREFIEDYGHPYILGFNLEKLKVDQSYLRFSSNHDTNLSVYQKSSDCYGVSIPNHFEEFQYR